MERLSFWAFGEDICRLTVGGIFIRPLRFPIYAASRRIRRIFICIRRYRASGVASDNTAGASAQPAAHGFVSAAGAGLSAAVASATDHGLVWFTHSGFLVRSRRGLYHQRLLRRQD